MSDRAPLYFHSHLGMLRPTNAAAEHAMREIKGKVRVEIKGGIANQRRRGLYWSVAALVVPLLNDAHGLTLDEQDLHDVTRMKLRLYDEITLPSAEAGAEPVAPRLDMTCNEEMRTVPDCDCPHEHWHIGPAGCCLDVHLEDDGSAHIILNTGEDDRELTIVGVNGLDEARRLAFAWTETAPPTEAAICAGWNAIAEQLSSALSERNDDRFKIMAFVHRHSIIEALTRPVPTDAAIRADEREKCAKVIDTMPSQMKPRDAAAAIRSRGEG